MSRILFAASLLVCASAYAQYDASVLGTVKDPTGLAVGDATVTLLNIANGVRKTVLTDGSGNYEFLNVRIGEYSLTAEKSGFKAAAAERFTVTAWSTVRKRSVKVSKWYFGAPSWLPSTT